MHRVSYIVNCREEDQTWFTRAIESIINQEGVQKHIILSTVPNDRCLVWIEEIKGDYDLDIAILYTDLPKSPPASFAQIDNAVQFIKGDYVTFCSANDPLVLNKSINEINRLKETGAKVCYSAFHLAVANGYEYRVLDCKGFPAEYTLERHLQSNFIYDGSMVESELFKKYMPFTDKWYNCGYWDLWLRIYKEEGNVFCYNSSPTKFYIQHEDSMHIKRQFNEELKALRDKHSAELVAHHRKELGL